LSQFRQGGVDPRKHRRLYELRNDPLRLSQTPYCEGTLFLGFVKQAQNHLQAANMMPIRMEMWILQDVRERYARTVAALTV
jgi:hypothetical protein